MVGSILWFSGHVLNTRLSLRYSGHGDHLNTRYNKSVIKIFLVFGCLVIKWSVEIKYIGVSNYPPASEASRGVY